MHHWPFFHDSASSSLILILQSIYVIGNGPPVKKVGECIGLLCGFCDSSPFFNNLWERKGSGIKS